MMLQNKDPVIEQKQRASLASVVRFLQKQHAKLAEFDFQRRKLLADENIDRHGVFADIAAVNEQVLRRRCEIALVVEVRVSVDAIVSDNEAFTRGVNTHALLAIMEKEVPHVSDECYSALADLCLLVVPSAESGYQRIFNRVLTADAAFENRNLER